MSVVRFNCGRWLGKGVDDGSTERLLVAELMQNTVDSEGMLYFWETCISFDVHLTLRVHCRKLSGDPSVINKEVLQLDIVTHLKCSRYQEHKHA